MRTSIAKAFMMSLPWLVSGGCPAERAAGDGAAGSTASGADGGAGQHDAGAGDDAGLGPAMSAEAAAPLPADVDLQACAIEASADGVPLSEPPRAYAGSIVTLIASADCDERLELAWYHGIPSDLSYVSSEREIDFRLFMRERFELRASYGGAVRLTRVVTVESIPTNVASSLLVEPVKPRSSQMARATLSAIVDAMYVPIVEVPSVASVDFELIALDERLRPAETVLSMPGHTSSMLAIPPQAPGWYELRAVARGAQGSIESTPLPASFEVVP